MRRRLAPLLLLAACGAPPEPAVEVGAVPPPAGDPAADCRAPGPAGALSPGEARALYDCFAAGLQAAYLSGDTGWIPRDRVAGYRRWALASRVPFAAEGHGQPFAMVWANGAAAAEYLRFPTDPDMPPGGLLALETFALEDGRPVPGPLYFMEKTDRGVSPGTNDWYFYALGPDGSPLAVDVVEACAACHLAAGQGGPAYPPPAARAGG